MIELFYILSAILEFLIVLFSLLVGFNLGKHSQALTPDGKERLSRIFQRTAPKREGVGVITRPTAEDNFYRDNPLAAKERDEMEKAIGNLQE